MNTILVTGGAGYIGSHACKALSQAGYHPVSYDNLTRGNAGAVKWGPLEKGDILDQSRLKTVIDQYRPEAVMHFAALAYVGESMEKPAQYWRNNVAGSLSLLEVMKRESITKLIFSSTCAVYGEPENVMLKEDHETNPINPYGTSKLVMERMIEDFCQAHSFDAVALRYFNAAGADLDGEIGENHDPEPHLIPLALMAVLKQGPPLRVFGDDYLTPDGTCIRDFVHVADIADAHVRALSYLSDHQGFHVFNLGSGKGESVLDILKTAEQIIGQPIPYSISKRRPGDPARLVSHADRARQLLNWQPKNSHLETMINSAWQWVRRQS